MRAESRYVLWPAGIAGLALWSPWAAVGGTLFFWITADCRPALAYYLTPFEKDRRLWLAPLGLLIALFFARHPFPPDDLLRDMTAWAWHYNYHKVFWGSPRVPGYDQYWAFDRIAGMVDRSLPAKWAPLVFQGAALLGFLGVFAAVLGEKLKDHPLRWTLVSLGLAWTLYTPVLMRIVSARPEIFFAIWALAAFLARGKRFWAWLGTGLLLTPTYWLAGAYAAAFWVLPDRSLRFRLFGGLLFGLATSLCWEGLSDGSWLHSFLHLSHMISYRVYGVAEDNGLSIFLQVPTLVLLPVLAVLLPWRLPRTRIPTLLLFFWFCLPWMIRYVDMLMPLGLVLLAEGLPLGWGLDWLPPWRARFRAAAFFGLFSVPWSLVPLAPPTLLHVPGSPEHPSRVLAPFGPKMYDTLYANPGRVRMAPAMDPGMTERKLQRLAQSPEKATCRQLYDSRAQYLITGQTVAHRPCLKLIQVRNGWMLWGVAKKPGR